MATIKEKAEESSSGYDEVQAPAIGRGFVLGANYVLEKVENILQDKNTGLVETWDELMTLVEQLKK